MLIIYQFLLAEGLVIKHTVTVTLEFRIRHLLLEFAAHAFCILGALKTAGTIPSGAF